MLGDNNTHKDEGDESKEKSKKVKVDEAMITNNSNGSVSTPRKVQKRSGHLITLVPPPPPNPISLRPENSGLLKEHHKDFKLALELVKSFKSKPDCISFFNKPVDPVALCIPDYFGIVRSPMDLGTIFHQLTKIMYHSKNEVVVDIRLTFTNALLYNCRGSIVYRAATSLLGELDDYIAKFDLLSISHNNNNNSSSSSSSNNNHHHHSNYNNRISSRSNNNIKDVLLDTNLVKDNQLSLETPFIGKRKRKHKNWFEPGESKNATTNLTGHHQQQRSKSQHQKRDSFDGDLEYLLSTSSSQQQSKQAQHNNHRKEPHRSTSRSVRYSDSMEENTVVKDEELGKELSRLRRQINEMSEFLRIGVIQPSSDGASFIPSDFNDDDEEEEEEENEGEFDDQEVDEAKIIAATEIDAGKDFKYDDVEQKHDILDSDVVNDWPPPGEEIFEKFPDHPIATPQKGRSGSSPSSIRSYSLSPIDIS